MGGSWSPRATETSLAAMGALLAVAFALGVDAAGRLLLSLAALGLLALVATDLALRPRLHADRSGVAVRTLGGRRFLPWSAVRRVRVDERTRIGLRTRTLEVDGGDILVVMSRRTLGADPYEVAETLYRLRPPDDGSTL